MIRTKEIILVFSIVVLSISLVILSSWTNEIVIFSNLPKTINKQIIYQIITLLGAIFFLSVLRLTKKGNFKVIFEKVIFPLTYYLSQ